MPIIDYKKAANKTEVKLLNDPTISEQNKRLLKRFLSGYDVKDSRRMTFLKHIRKLLLAFPDAEKAVMDRDGLNDFFYGLRVNYRPATCATYINIVGRFLRWLNNGEKPPGMRDVKAKPKAELLRDLKPEDMVTWDEMLRIAETSCSLQFAAIILTQLDAGFRPGEHHDLNYGDVVRHERMAVIHVRQGKTGKRSVVLLRCIPALFKWLDAHPTKRLEDPLWILEKATYTDVNNGRQVKRYSYPAMSKRLRELAKKSGIHKPMDFYNLRHSSCVLDKRDNVPVDLAADRHGHSSKFYLEVYGRLSIEDTMQRFESHYGISTQTQKSESISHRQCHACRAINEHEKNWCGSCGCALNVQANIEIADSLQLTSTKDSSDGSDELQSLRHELNKAKKREKSFRLEQLQLLEEMKDIQRQIAQEKAILMQPPTY